jgi:hypothetical protein
MKTKQGLTYTIGFRARRGCSPGIVADMARFDAATLTGTTRDDECAEGHVRTATFFAHLTGARGEPTMARWASFVVGATKIDVASAATWRRDDPADGEPAPAAAPERTGMTVGKTFDIVVRFTRDDGREAKRAWTHFGSVTQALEDAAAYARTEIAVGSRIRGVVVAPSAEADLLPALETALRWVEQTGGQDSETAAQARAAIAAAKQEG